MLECTWLNWAKKLLYFLFCLSPIWLLSTLIGEIFELDLWSSYLAKKLRRKETGRTRQGFIMFKTSYNSQVMIFMKQKLFSLTSEESVSYIFFFTNLPLFRDNVINEDKGKRFNSADDCKCKKQSWLGVDLLFFTMWLIYKACKLYRPTKLSQSKLKPILNWSVIYPRLRAVCLLFLWILIGCLIWYFPQFALITYFDHCYWF